MDITNRSKKPLSVPLPGGKKLFLGPGKTGQVTPKALEHPPLAKLLEAGEVELSGGGHTPRATGGSTARPPSSARQKGTGAIRQSGDR